MWYNEYDTQFYTLFLSNRLYVGKNVGLACHIRLDVKLCSNNERNCVFRCLVSATHLFIWRRVTNVNVGQGFEYIEFERLGGKAEIYLNGEKIGDNFTYRMPRSSSDSFNRPHRFYCDFAEGVNEIKVVSEAAERVRPHISGYVKIGKTVAPKDQFVRLHYGKARVFVKACDEKEIELFAKIADNSNKQ